MNHVNMNREDELRQAVRSKLGNEPLPAKAQTKLEEAYSMLESIPQDPPRQADSRSAGPGKRVVRKGMVIAAAAAIVALFGGTAFAVSHLIEMKPGDVPFFDSGNNLPIYNSLQEGASNLNAPVGDTVQVDGVSVTLNSISCDRSIVNLFFTIEQEGGFDLSAQSIYADSQENEWVRLQGLAPRLTYSIRNNGQELNTGSVNLLDSYLEDGKVKCMMRIVPEATLPDQVEIILENAYLKGHDEEATKNLTFSVGLDLSTVSQPDELGSQDLVFATSSGNKTLGLKRFTRSELGTVMVTCNDSTMSEDGRSYGPPDTAMYPHALMMIDDQGNTLTAVNAGDGMGRDSRNSIVIELAGLSPDAKSVTFTPMLANDESLSTVEGREALNEQNEQHIDVSQIGSKLATSEYGGYELTGWDVSNNTVSLSLKPYGWLANGSAMMELIPDQDAAYLASEFTNPDGQSSTGYHSAIRYVKHDYRTGELVQMDSYYAATDEELRGLLQYHYRSMFGYYQEDTTAAQVISFKE